jgi:acyl-CoA reductase-like NAD-dependent aldehyde dehydrogenase
MNAMRTEVRSVQLTIGGAMADGEDGTYPVYNPVRPDELVVRAPSASLDQLDQAVRAARRAGPGWAALGFDERSSCLQAACRRAEELLDLESAAALLTREHGKVLGEAIFDVATTAGMLGAFAPLMAEVQAPRPAGNATVERVPHGVVAAILPFNWPAAVMGNKVLPALLAGNTVVVKTPPTCPGAVLELAAALAAGLPPGVLNTLNGPDPGFGAALVDHPGIDMVTFTGGATAGKSVLATCARHLRPAVLELGGNDAAVIAPDLVPTDALADRLLEAAFTTSGQVCMAIKRLYVPAERLQGWLDALAGRLSCTVVGDGLEEGVTMGPVHTEAARDRVEAMIAEAALSAARVVRPASITNSGSGWTVPPALVVDPDPTTDLVTEEQFAPALPLLSYRGIAQAVEAANNTRFGLCASVWSADIDLADSVARQLRAGTVWTNAHGMAAMDHLAPMGGWGESGLGLEMGAEGMAAFSRPRVLRRASL